MAAASTMTSAKGPRAAITPELGAVDDYGSADHSCPWIRSHLVRCWLVRGSIMTMSTRPAGHLRSSGDHDFAVARGQPAALRLDYL